MKPEQFTAIVEDITASLNHNPLMNRPTDELVKAAVDMMNLYNLDARILQVWDDLITELTTRTHKPRQIVTAIIAERYNAENQ